jgi:translation initiation factor 1
LPREPPPAILDFMPDFATLIKSRNFTVIVRLETAGRKGKPVTLLEGLPKQELFLKSLLSALKAACGAGGTYHMDRREGAVEVQGDQRDRVCAVLEKAEMKVSRR